MIRWPAIISALFVIVRFKTVPWNVMHKTTRAFAATSTMLLIAILLAPIVQAGSIFDDNWTPPAPSKATAQPTPAVPPPAPATEPGKPDGSTKPLPAIPAPVPTRRAIPTASDQTKSRKLFKEIYAKELADRSAAARRALAAKLLAQAASVQDSPADEFVLLAAATEAGKEGSDLGAVCKAADAMADAYDVDGLRVKSERATKMTLRADAPAVAADNFRTGMKLVDELVAAEDYATAARLLQSLKAAAPDVETRTQVQTRVSDLEAQRTSATRVAAQIQKLGTSPDDPAANLAVGEYFCFIKQNWKQGLPLLVKGSNPTLSTAASADLANPTDGAKQAAVGDLWWDAGEKEKSTRRQPMHQRAGYWYSKATSDQQFNGLARVMVKKRLNEILSSQTNKDLTLVYTFTDKASLSDFEIVGNAVVRPEGGMEVSHGTPSEIQTKASFGTPIRAEFEAHCLPGGVFDLKPAILTAADHGGGFTALLGNSFNTKTQLVVFGSSINLPHIPLKSNEAHRIVLSIDNEGNAEAEVDGKSVYKGVVSKDAKLQGHVLLSGGRGDVVYTKVLIHAKKVE